MLKVQNPNVQYTEDAIISDYNYVSTHLEQEGENIVLKPTIQKYTFRTKTKVPKLGIMLVGLGGNNGTTFMGGILANKHQLTWNTKKGVQYPTWFGSLTQATTTKVAVSGAKEIFAPLKKILPLVDPNDVVVSGWDISSMNLSEAMQRAEVFDYDLQQKLAPYLKDIKPLPAVYYEDFIALNQKDRADNIIKGGTKLDHVETLRKNIRDFKANNGLDKVVVLWTANTERFSQIIEGVHDTVENLMKGLQHSHPEISSSTVYAVASILEGCNFINGSPQNTFVPAVVELADKHKVFLTGNDFKTGQTKMKTMLVDFLVQAGIKPKSIVSYNHLGNNDGKNLSSESQFRSKEISKKSCVDDMLESNFLLRKRGAENNSIDHTIVIKYLPAAGDTKKAMDEYISEIFMGGQHTLTLYNVCEDSLLAAPIILDLILLSEIFDRIEYKIENETTYRKFDTILSFLGYLVKAPQTREEAPLINSLTRQKNCIENLFKICHGLPIDDGLLLEFRAK